MNKKVLVIIQARLASTRFPNKVLKKIGKKTVEYWRQSTLLGDVCKRGYKNRKLSFG